MSTSTATDSHGHGHDDGHGQAPPHEQWAVHAHISDVKFLVAIFSGLIMLTVITVAVSRVDLGEANTIVAVGIATVKAALVATFFMHLRHDKPFHAVIFVAAFVFLGIFITYTLDDISTRGRIDPGNGTTVLSRNGEKAPGGFTPIVTPELGAGGEHGAATEHGATTEHGAAEHGAAAEH